MSSFSVWVHLKNTLFFTLWVMVWNLNLGKIYFFVLPYKTLRAIVRLIFLIFFSGNFFWWIISSFPFIYIFLKVQFFLVFQNFNQFLHGYAGVEAYWKHLLSFLLMGFIVAFFIFHQIRAIYIWSTAIQVYFVTFVIQ